MSEPDAGTLAGPAAAGSGLLAADPAFSGPLGEYAQIAGTMTEADPYAVLVTALVCAATAIGRGAAVRTGDTVQPPTLFALLVAETPKANRGISWRLARQMLDAAAPPGWGRVVQGLSGPAGLTGAISARTRPAPGQGDSPGLLVHEPMFARSLAMSRKSSSPLPWLLRNAWDGLPLDAVHHPGTRHHVGLVAHVTLEQLRTQTSLTDASASFLGRFLFVRVRRPRPVPDEGSVPARVTQRIGALLAPRLEHARQAGPMRRGVDCTSFWFRAYQEIAADDPGGLLGIAVARAAWFVTRLSLVYAVTDGDDEIRPRHLEAALSLWRYCRESAAWALSDGGDEVIQPDGGDAVIQRRLLEAISEAGPVGLSLTGQSAAFGRNVPADRIAAARSALEAGGTIETVTLAAPRGRGRPARVSRRRHVPSIDSFPS